MRTTHRSTTGKKLYAVRDKAGRFKDVQTYKRAHSRDLRTKSVAERTVKGWAYVHDNGRVLLAWEGTSDGHTGIVRCTITLHEPKRARK